MRIVILVMILALPLQAKAQSISPEGQWSMESGSFATDANTIDAARPDSIVNALQELGFQAKLETDSQGDPLIRSRMEGIRTSIYFYGCTDNKDCQDLLFSTGFNLTDGTTASRMNEWNETKLVGKAYIDDESDPWLEFYVGGVTGMTQESFERNVDQFGNALSGFKDHIDW